jgi:tRNA (guanosine-2'-O-)-methyltransferase
MHSGNRPGERVPPRSPTDRNALPSVERDGAKVSRYPRTDRRARRIDDVLARRQASLTVVLEDVHDQHNASAVLRSCDAVGVLDVHLVYRHEEPPRRAFHRTTSASAAKWVRTRFHASIADCYADLRANGFRIFATALQDDTIDLYDLDLTLPTALVFGNEHRGVTDLAVELADGTVSIPMQGMVESLNISVACAVSLYEAMRQRRVAGMYEQPQLDGNELRVLRENWLRK